MRLFISSYRAGKYPDRLVELFGKGAKLAVITNATDYKSPADRQVKVEENQKYFKALGLEPTEIDLRPYFNKPGAEKLLAKFNVVWLAGGNVFLLRRALSYSGVDKYLYDAVRKNEVILGGESAGAIIMSPTLKFSEVDTNEDSPNYIPEPYKKPVIWDGLDFISYVPVPHYQSVDFIGIDEYVENLKKTKIPYKTMTNDQAILINGSYEEFLA